MKHIVQSIRTERLTLRRVLKKDIDSYRKIFSNPHIYNNTTGIPYICSTRDKKLGRAMVREWITEVMKKDVMSIVHDGKVVGCMRVHVFDGAWKAEIGYFIVHEEWNKGYATEAVGGIIMHLILNLGITRIDAMCFTDNPASATVLENNGMQLEGTHRSFVEKDGNLRDVFRYAILRKS